MFKVGLFGVGHLGKFHLKALQEIPEFEIIGFYDPDDKNAANAEKDFKVKRYLDANKLIAEANIIDIVSPTTTHFEIASKVLKQSKHLFIEKPITANIEEAEKLLKISREANVKVQVGHVERFNPAFKKTLQYINQPLFIESHRLAEFNPRGNDVPVIYDLMIHDIDIVLSIVKSNVKSISASGVEIINSTPDIANARIEFDNGCVANLTASRISMKNMRKTRIFQNNAYISIDFLDKTTEIITMKELTDSEKPDPLSIIIEGDKNKNAKEIKLKKIIAEPDNAIKSELKSFYQAIYNDRTTDVSIYQGYEALKIASDIVKKMNY